MYIFIPVAVDYQTKRWPVMTFWIMGICVLFFLLGLHFSLAGSEAGELDVDPFIGLFGLNPSRSSILACVMHMFIHGGFFHLVGNMIYLFLFGAVVEDTLGRGKFLLFYLAGGLVAAGTHVLVAGSESQIPMVGASGAISACLGGFVVLYAKTQIEFRYLLWFFVFVKTGTFYVVSWLVISAWFLWDLISMILSYRSGAEGGGVAFGAHVGGMLAGLVMVSLGRRFAKRPERELALVDSETPTVRNVYVYHQEEELGPYSKFEVRQMLRSGVLSGESLFWMDGMVEWLPIVEL